MDRSKYNQAKILRNEIRDLELLQRDLESNSDVLCGTVSDPFFSHKITPKMKRELLKMCIGEIAILENEFEKL